MSQKLVTVLISGDSLLPQIQRRRADGLRLMQIISGASDGEQELLYFLTDERDVQILRMKAPKRMELASVTDFYPAAAVFERVLKEKCRLRFQKGVDAASVLKEEEEAENGVFESPVLDLEALVKDREAGDCVPAVERISGTDSYGYGMTYCTLLEALSGLRITPRTEALRLVFQETVRTACHLLWFAELLEPLGMRLFAVRCLQLREGILSFMDHVAGSRMIPSLCRIGGMKVDLSAEELSELSSILKTVEREWKLMQGELLRDQAVLRSLRGRCACSEEEVRSFGLTGPTARACGLEWDCRSQEERYGQLGFEPVVGESGDLLAQCAVRGGEILQSARLACKQIQKMPEGVVTASEKKTFSGERALRVEQPEGEAVLYAKAAGKGQIETLTVRRPEAMMRLAGAAVKEGSVALWLR